MVLYTFGLWQYLLTGQTATPQDEDAGTVPPLRWHGYNQPSLANQGYVTQYVKGRGSNRASLDLLVTCPGTLAVARLRHDTLKGRVKRHGFLVEFTDVLGASTNSWRRELEQQRNVHLCFSSPCEASPTSAPDGPLQAKAIRKRKVPFASFL